MMTAGAIFGPTCTPVNLDPSMTTSICAFSIEIAPRFQVPSPAILSEGSHSEELSAKVVPSYKRVVDVQLPMVVVGDAV
jgi:hypothetical protein